jgi:F-box protein 25/32
MPFISKDWRSPGEAWVKTEEGWEKKKVLENCKTIKQGNSEEPSAFINNETAIQPHCHITIKSTKEVIHEYFSFDKQYNVSVISSRLQDLMN